MRKDMISGLCDAIAIHPRLFLFASLLLAAIFIAWAPFVKTVNNVDYFTLDDPDAQFYEEFKESFGNDEFFVIAFESEDIFTKEHLTLIKNITEELTHIEEVREVKSLANVDDMVGSAEYFLVKKFLEEIPEDPQALEQLKAQALRNPLYVRNLISPDARTAAIVVFTYHQPADEDYRKRLIAQTNNILERYRQEGYQFSLAGWTTTNLSLSQYMKKDIETFIPITYLLIILTIWFVFRNHRLTLLAFANISACMGSTMGLFALTGIPLNNITTIVPPLIMALSLSDTVHIFSHMDIRVLAEYPEKHKAMASVLKKVIVPCFLTTLTTAVGFLSLAVSTVPPIRQFAWMASAGMLFEYFYAFFLLPPLIIFFSPEKLYKDYSHHTRSGLTTVLHSLNRVIQQYNKLIVGAICILVLVACWFTGKIRVETNLLEYFKETSSLRTSLTFVEKRLGGVGSLDISLQATEEDTFKNPSHLKVIENLQQYIQSLENVDVTTSLVDFLKEMNQSFHDEDSRYYVLPETKEMVAQYLLLYDSDDIGNFINTAYDHARIAVRISEHSSAGQERLLETIREYIKQIQHLGIEIKLTGRAVQDVNTIDALVQGQVSSLSLGTIVISITMILALKSLTIGVLSLVPNLFPILLNFGIMGADDIPLNTATALISAVAIGIAVDNTIHFLSEYKKKRGCKLSISQAVEEVIYSKGYAFISSSLIICIGFGVLVLSSFVPTINFGMLSAIIMLTALLGDIVFLPSILLLKR